MNADTVVQMPALLDRLGNKLRGLISRSAENKTEFVEINVEFCVTLVQARDQFAANIEFGRWCDAVELGKDVLNHQTRAAAVAMGRDPVGLRACLEATERRSLRHIYDEEFGRFTRAGKTDQPKRGRPTGSKAHASRQAAAAAHLDDGKTLEEAAQTLNDGSVQVVKTTVAWEQGRRDMLAELLDAAGAQHFTEKGTLRIDDAIRVKDYKREKEFQQRVYAEVRRQIDAADNFAREDNKRLRQENANLQRMLTQKAVYTLEQFNVLRRALHPDRIQRFGDDEMVKEFAKVAQLLAEKKKRLTGVD